MEKKSSGSVSPQASNDAFSDLEQLRLIVFGQAKQALEDKIDALNQRVSDEMNMLQEQVNQRHSELLEKLAENHSTLLQKLNELDEQQQSDKSDLSESIASVASELEMADNASKDDSQALHKRIDQEVDDIQDALNKAVAQLSEKLDTMNNNLATSKTDRKILAKLLANVATNLDADE
ncbi:hypothetical protein PN836_010655 [Ningiella sp. W23]|uniref:hypothetical protein n=1 Tax=Ningiella sp. W23 TaxID=3023715 RepID=UPI003757200F